MKVYFVWSLILVVCDLQLSQADSKSANGYVGCFVDSIDDRDLPDGDEIFITDTVESCAKFCRKSKYFAMENGNECRCGEKYGKHGASDDGDCYAICPGEQKCGGPDRNSVYNTELYLNRDTGKGYFRIPGNDQFYRLKGLTNTTRVKSKEACLDFCFGNPNSTVEICQVAYPKCDCESTEILCKMGDMRYYDFIAFSKSFLEEDPYQLAIYERYYRDVSKNFPLEKSGPTMFFPLNSAFRDKNLGSLRDLGVTLDMGPSTPRFDCKYRDCSLGLDPSILRLDPKDNYLIQILNASLIPLNETSEFTFLFFFSAAENFTTQQPVMEGYNANLTAVHWRFYIDYGVYFSQNCQNFNAEIGRNKMIGGWGTYYHAPELIAFTRRKDKFSMFFHSSADNIPNPRLGERISLGRRIGEAFQPEKFKPFNGCMSNIMMFSRSLADDEINQMTKRMFQC